MNGMIDTIDPKDVPKQLADINYLCREKEQAQIQWESDHIR